jgi:hypothetical protein
MSNKLKIEMLKLYKPVSDLDWLNYKLVKEKVTLHHIIKKEDNGKKELSNMALIMPNGHQYLHLIEYKDIETYIALNKIFKYINKQEHEPTTEQRQLIEYLLISFEKEHKNDKTSKGKSLIKYKYLDRD